MDQETAFFTIWEKIEQHQHLYNFRMLFDAGWEAGINAVKAAMKILQSDPDLALPDVEELMDRIMKEMKK